MPVLPPRPLPLHTAHLSETLPLIETDSSTTIEKPPLFGSLSKDDEVFEEKDELNLDNLGSILEYARDGDAVRLRALLKTSNGAVGQKDSNGLCPLHYAAHYGNVAAVEVLLEFGHDVKFRSDKRLEPLHFAAKYFKKDTSDPSASETGKGDNASRVIALLVNAGAEVNHRDDYGLSPLHYAAMRGNVAAAEALIERGANINVVDNKGVSPLMTAAVYGSVGVIELLLRRGAIVDGVDQGQNTLVHAICRKGNCVVIDILFNQKRDILMEMLRKVNNEKKTGLQLAVEGDHVQLVARLLDLYQRIPNFQQQFTQAEKLLLHTASEKGFEDIVQLLLSRGATVHRVNKEGRLPVHVAALNNKKKVVELLLEKDPQTLEAVDHQGMTPLLLAITQNNQATIHFLIDQKNANIRAQDNHGRSIVFLAAKANSLPALQIFFDYLKKREQFLKGKVARLMSVRQLLSNTPDQNQERPLHIVATKGYLEMARLLKEAGAFLEVLNEDEKSPLHLTAEEGRLSIVKQFLQWDKRMVLGKDNSGQTPLHKAAEKGHDKVALELLRHGADINACDMYEETPLVLAVRAGELQMVQLLVDHDAILEPKVMGRNRSLSLGEKVKIDKVTENSVLDIAIEANHKDVALVLVSQSCWIDLLRRRNVKEEADYGLERDSPLRRLIIKFPDVAKEVFDRCIEKTDNGNIQYFYEFLDDSYVVVDEDGNEVPMVSPFDDETGMLRKETKPYMKNYHKIYKNHPLKLMVASERLQLLSHPLVVNLLKLKWNNLGRYVYYSALFLYILYLVMYTVYLCKMPPPFNVLLPNQTFKDLSKDLDETNDTCSSLKLEKDPSLVFYKIVVIILCVVQLVKELFQLAQRRLAYFSMENAMECFIYIGSILTVLDFCDCSRETGIRMTWQWMLASGVSFLAWMNLLLLIRKLPRFGIYVLMFFDILKTFSRFFIIFALFVIAFSISFFIMLQNKPEFSSFPSSIIKTTVMMIGEFEYTAIFHGEERLFDSILANMVFVVFVLVITILLMNLLVGLAVDDIKAVQEKAEIKRLSMQVDLVLQVEMSMPSIFRVLSVRGKQVVSPSTMTPIKWIRKLFGDDRSEALMETIERTLEEEATSSLVERELKAQRREIANIQTNIDSLNDKHHALEKLLLQVAKNVGVLFDDRGDVIFEETIANAPPSHAAQ